MCLRLVSLIILLVLVLSDLIGERCVQGLAEADALEQCMLGLRVHWALLVQDLVELVLLVPHLLALWFAIHNRDEIVGLVLSGRSRVVSLALVEAVVVIPLALVVVAVLGVAVMFLVLLTGPSLHHVMKFHDGVGAVASKIAVEVLLGKAILEAVDDVLIGDVGDGGASIEETPGVRPQGLVLLLLALRQVMASTCSKHGALEVVDKNPLQVLPGVDGVWLEALKPGEWH
jgi:hypothetical protein